MQSAITQPVLEIKGNRNLGIAVALGFTGISAAVGYSLRTQLFLWKNFNPEGLNTIFFLILVLIAILTWLDLFNDLPRLRFDPTGIWKRKNFLAHSMKLMVTWDNISYYTSQVIPSETIPTENLVIRMKDPDEPVELGITDSDKSREDILYVLKIYAGRYGFNDFVEELNN